MSWFLKPLYDDTVLALFNTVANLAETIETLLARYGTIMPPTDRVALEQLIAYSRTLTADLWNA